MLRQGEVEEAKQFAIKRIKGEKPTAAEMEIATLFEEAWKVLDKADRITLLKALFEFPEAERQSVLWIIVERPVERLRIIDKMRNPEIEKILANIVPKEPRRGIGKRKPRKRN